MKKFFVAALALAIGAYGANAQSVKTPAAAKASVEKALEATQNPKAAAKPATWFNLAKSYMDAYNAQIGNILIGATMQELQIYGLKETAKAVESVEVGGQTIEKHVFAKKNLYFNPNGQLIIIEITRPIYDNCLNLAFEAQQKAVELDAKLAKAKDYKAMQKDIAQKLIQEAYDSYNLQKIAKASELFEAGACVLEAKPACEIDSNSVYNAAFTAWMVQDTARAKKLFERCLTIEYYGEEGEAFAKLADIADKQGDQAKRQEYLEQAFVKFPQSQSVLIGLINFYMNGAGNTDRLFELLESAKANEPDNASLYYVEGNINAQLGKTENAVVAYEKCAQINPDYEFGYIGEGQMFYNLAIEIQEKASNEMNDEKYMVLVGEFEKALKSCITPFEKAFNLTKDAGVKVAVAEYLKNACFRFRTESQEMSAKYKAYEEYVSANK